MTSFASLLWSLLWRSALLLAVLRMGLQFAAESWMRDASAADQQRWAPALLWMLMAVVTGVLAVWPGALSRLLVGGRLALQERQWRLLGVGTAVCQMLLALAVYLLAAQGQAAQADSLGRYGFVPLFGLVILLLTLAMRRADRQAAAR